MKTFYLVQTPTGLFVYQDEDIASQQDPLKAAWRTRWAALQAWLDANPGVKFSSLAGAKQLAYAAAVDALKTSGAAWVKSHVLHTDGAPLDIREALYIGQWDGVSPFVRTLLGTFPPGGVPVAGWPQTDTPPDPQAEPRDEDITAALTADKAEQASAADWFAEAQEKARSLDEKDYVEWSSGKGVSK